MLRSTTVFDFQVRDEDVLVDRLTDVATKTGRDMLPDLAETIRRVGGEAGTLFLTADLQGVAYWSTDQPVDWPFGLVIAQWHLLAEHGTEVDVI